MIFTIIDTRFAPAAAQVQMMRNELSDEREAFLTLTCDRLGRDWVSFTVDEVLRASADNRNEHT